MIASSSAEDRARERRFREHELDLARCVRRVADLGLLSPVQLAELLARNPKVPLGTLKGVLVARLRED